MSATDPATIVATYSAALHAQIASLLCDLADVLNGRAPRRPTDSDALLRAVVTVADLIDKGMHDIQQLEAFTATASEITSTTYGARRVGAGWAVRPVRGEGDRWRLRVDTTTDLTREAAHELALAIQAAITDEEWNTA